MSFDPKKHIIRIQGNREYLPVAARLIWFRQDHPDWGIVTNPVEINMERQYAIFSCSIFNAEGKLMATATKMENIRGFPDYLEKAETGSVGRALAYVGYGTQFAPELEEESRFADAPYAARPAPPRDGSGNGTRPAPNTPAASRPTGAAANNGGFTRVREPDRPVVDPAGADDDDEGEFSEEEPTTGESPSVESQSTPRPNPLAGNRCSVEGCSNVLTAGQMTMSMSKFGRPVCLLHQKDIQPVANAVPGNGRRGTASATAAVAETEESYSAASS